MILANTTALCFFTLHRLQRAAIRRSIIESRMHSSNNKRALEQARPRNMLLMNTAGSREVYRYDLWF